MPQKKTVLVTGGCGYIGSHVNLKLAAAGYEVVVIDNLSTGCAESLLHGEKLYLQDLNDTAALDLVFRKHQFHAVYHFAASIDLPKSVSDPLGYYENNTVNTLKLLQTCIAHKVGYFIFSSTAAVYSPIESSQLKESSPTHPSTPYGRSKLMDEWILNDVAKAHPLKYVTLRYFNVAGADTLGRLGQRSSNSCHLFKTACEASLGLRNELIIYGNDYPTHDGTGVRDYIHVDDLASAHTEALSYLDGGGESTTFNCGYGRGFSVKEVINAFEYITGRRMTVKIGPRRLGDLAETVADVSKIKSTLCWKPQHNDLQLIVQSALDWEKHKLLTQIP